MRQITISEKNCEKNFKRAYSVNSLIPYNFCKYLNKNNLKIVFIQISTDHFFFDKKKLKRKENDFVNLKNNYSLTKFIAESFVKNYKYSIILRTNFLNKKNSFSTDLYKKLKNEKNIYLFTDYICSTIHMDLLVDIISKIYKERKFGIYNLGSRDSLSKKDFFLKYLENLNIEPNSKKIKCVSINNEKIIRPNNISLNINKFENTFKINLPSIKETIKLLSN